MTLAGHTALVTGGSKGIGRGIALELARQGARVAINYRRDGPEVQETMAALATMGRPALAVAADVRRADQVSAATAVRPRYRDRCRAATPCTCSYSIPRPLPLACRPIGRQCSRCACRIQLLRACPPAASPVGSVASRDRAAAGAVGLVVGAHIVLAVLSLDIGGR
jgi:hypothetical protein